MKYKGKELVEITTPQIFDPPQEMLVWNDTFLTEPKKVNVCAIVKLKDYYAAIEIGKVPSYQWQHCAEIPKARRVTNRELSKWLAQGNGEKKVDDCIAYVHTYLSEYSNEEADKLIKVRKWSDDDWHEPTVDYMFGEQY